MTEGSFEAVVPPYECNFILIKVCSFSIFILIKVCLHRIFILIKVYLSPLLVSLKTVLIFYCALPVILSFTGDMSVLQYTMIVLSKYAGLSALYVIFILAQLSGRIGFWGNSTVMHPQVVVT